MGLRLEATPVKALIPLLADMSADAVFVLVERRLISLGDMAMVEARVEPLLIADHAIFAMKMVRLRGREIAFTALHVNAPILVQQPTIDAPKLSARQSVDCSFATAPARTIRLNRRAFLVAI